MQTAPRCRMEADQGELSELALVCKALSHPVRVKILRYLLGTEGCVCGEIVKALPLAQSTVSQHLKSLKQAGLIRGEVEGPTTCYCVDPATLRKFQEMVAALGSCGANLRPAQARSASHEQGAD